METPGNEVFGVVYTNLEKNNNIFWENSIHQKLILLNEIKH